MLRNSFYNANRARKRRLIHAKTRRQARSAMFSYMRCTVGYTFWSRWETHFMSNVQRLAECTQRNKNEVWYTQTHTDKRGKLFSCIHCRLVRMMRDSLHGQDGLLKRAAEGKQTTHDNWRLKRNSTQTIVVSYILLTYAHVAGYTC